MPDSPAASDRRRPPVVRGLRRSVKALLLCGSVLAFLSVFAIWVERQALDTDAWVHTSSAMLQNAEIRSALSEYIVDQLNESVDVEGELEGILPDFAKGLTDNVNGIAEEGIEAALGTPAARSIWETANRTAHEEFVAVLEDKGDVVSTAGGNVSLKLAVLLKDLAGRLGVDPSVIEQLPSGSAQIEIMHSDQLSTAQTVVATIQGLALALSLLTLAVFALAIWLARGARPAAVLLAGGGLIGAGLAAVALRLVAGKIVVGALATSESAEPAVEAAWSIGTSLMVEVALTAIAVGVLFATAGWLASPNALAGRARRFVAPTLQRHPAFVYGGPALAVIFYLVSDRGSGLRSSLTALTLAAMATFAIHALRRQTAREFPDA
ncbi:MAG TPA: hypothetical protein VIJ21_12380 [Solirubrobacterales bacterium]